MNVDLQLHYYTFAELYVPNEFVSDEQSRPQTLADASQL